MNSEAPKNLVQDARQLLQQSLSGSLATQSQKHPGYPFVSLTPFALTEACEPVLLLSSLATHTRNAAVNSAASLLVTSNSGENTSDLADGRLTLLGDLQPVEDAQLESARTAYLDRHPAARQWESFGDFHFFRLDLIDVFFVAGFGSMGWIQPQQLMGN